MNKKELQDKLFEMKDKKYKEFHSNLCPGTNNIIGIRVPVLRAFAKEIIKLEDYNRILEYKPDFYEETMLQGMIIGLKKSDLCASLREIEKFVPKIDNWAVCDTFCAGLKIIKKYPEDFWRFLEKYLKSYKEFEIRFAVVVILDYYINERYLEKVLKVLNDIKHEGYYVKMAVAWAVSICYIKFPKRTMGFLKDCDLDNFTYNKAIQKIIESYRVENKDKEILKKMKK